MSIIFLNLNEVMIFGPSESGDMAEIYLGTLSCFRKHPVKNVGVVCYSALTSDKMSKWVSFNWEWSIGLSPFYPVRI